ncbi:hypothetical protein CSKR_105419 [Clonorchis sinensis]|uniref:Uncharacterized protein n=1 Tax=Clonorchis sinensis TaxID=79923 RepID=A0A3R7GK56_CLOSI|nr:hypothetical protein CSKR_105419 [Clonorchis sinensis]
MIYSFGGEFQQLTIAFAFAVCSMVGRTMNNNNNSNGEQCVYSHIPGWYLEETRLMLWNIGSSGALIDCWSVVELAKLGEQTNNQTRLKCDRITFGRNQSCHRQRSSLHHHIPGTSEPITIGTIQTTIDRRGDWNPTAGPTTLRPEETFATSELQLACEKSGPTSLSDIDLTHLIL